MPSFSELRSAAERPVYAFSAVFLTLSQVHFAGQLLDSALFRRQYEMAKGGHRMDFTRLADNFLGIDLEWIAAIFFLATFAPPSLPGFGTRGGTLGVYISKRPQPFHRVFVEIGLRERCGFALGALPPLLIPRAVTVEQLAHRFDDRGILR